MNTKLFAALACGAALAFGACSGGGAPATPTTPGPTDPGAGPTDPGTDAKTQAQKDFDKALEDARGVLATARAEVTRVEALAKAADTEKERTDAAAALTAARTALAAAVNRMKALEAPDGDVNRRGRAVAAARDADAALAADTAKLTAGEAALARLAASRAWYNRNLARHDLGNGGAQVPSEGGRDGAHVRIQRIPRTIVTSPTDSTQKTNPAAFTSGTFEPVMYADGKLLFSVADDAAGGDEFKVGGNVYTDDAGDVHQRYTYTGLKLTSDGIVIRVGGTKPADNAPIVVQGDFTDTRRNITMHVDSGGQVGGANLHGQNGWDLVLTFGAPQTMSVPVGAPSRNHQSDWTGNGHFYWRSFVPAADSQLETGGAYYASNAFNQPDGHKDLGTYELWLSNYAGVDTMLEPTAGSGGDPYPEDDAPYYLKYAAYGLFVYTADRQTFRSGGSGHSGRIHAMYFGYSAFADVDDQRTTDIGTAITSAKFHGYTLAQAFVGEREAPQYRDSKMLRGDATFTVTIPSSGSGTIEGDLENFEEWTGSRWKDLTTDLSVDIPGTAITDAGTFSATVTASPDERSVDFPRLVPNSNANYALAGGIARGPTASAGINGSFYGPRDDSADLEVAGSWWVTVGLDEQWQLTGSFGAKQKPAATSGN